MPRLIDADAVIDIAMQYCPDDDGSCSKADVDIREMLVEIELLPTVDAEPVRHGKWVHNKWSNMRHDYSCSLCGCRIEGVDPFSLSATTYNYCPECGAVMDGVEE